MKTPLSEYTTEELRQELILRRKKPEKHIPEYEEFEGTVECIYKNIGGFNRRGYLVRSDHPFLESRGGKKEFFLKQGCFKVATAPQIGDRVLLRYRRTKIRKKKKLEIFDFANAKIVKVL